MEALARDQSRVDVLTENSGPIGGKQTDIGTIPDGWDVLPLSQLLDFQNGFNAEKSSYGAGVPFANVLEVITKDHLTEADIPGRVTVNAAQLQTFLVRPGDILFNRTSETQDELGLASVYVGNAQIIFGGFVIRGRIKSNRLNATCAGYLLRAPAVRRQIISRGQGAVRANIGQSELGSVMIPLPPTHDQAVIAEALADADRLIEELEQVLLKKRQIKNGVMQELLSGQRRLPGFVGEWGRQSFGEVFEFLPTATNSRADLNAAGDTYYIHYGDIHTRFHSHLNLRHQKPPRILRQKCRNAAYVCNGDWIMADASEDFDGVCKSVEVLGLSEGDKVVSGLHTFLLREKSPTFVSGFKGHLGNLKSLRDQYLKVMTGMKVFGVSKTALRDLALPIPKPQEQEAIVSILSDMEADISALEARLAKARLIKQGMIQKLLTGGCG
ncbi:restriction endonuclease subunit S [Shinella pollutisoli]|uniref:Restriction endonuclease subunit S n=1 Tax=Shinella pollutisoli TaxID=2250594 RepID=A0ABV7DJC3_9HYPH|nr:restriction endonuclease subunit S [Shinella pollutisoli]